jgi:hypothetical protein
MQLADRDTSILTVLGDDASQDGDNEDRPSSSSSSFQRVDPYQPPRNSATGLPKPIPMSSRRVSTYGSVTTQSSRHRRLLETVSPSSLRQVYAKSGDSSQDIPFSERNGIVGSASGVGSMVNSPPVKTALKNRIFKFLFPPRLRPKLVDATEPCLAESDKWMKEWAAAETGGVQTDQAEQPVQENRHDISVDNQTSSEQVESTYLPRCPWLEHAFLSSGSKIIFAGWVLYSPNDAAVRTLPVRQDIVYVMLLEDIPKIYLARDKDQDMSTLDVSPTMRAEIKDISKSHGRGVVLRQDGVVHGTLVPISLPSYMFKNQSLVDDDEFEDLAYRTIAPFRRDSYTNSSSPQQWCNTEYHQEYAPVAQLEAAMHLMFVMDSWMTKMLKR